MRRLLFLFAVLAGGGDALSASYSSLTPAERQLVDRAFEQAGYYRYYDAWVKGRDTIEATGAPMLVDRAPVSKTEEDQTYDIPVTIRIEDQEFRRIMTAKVRVKTQTESRGIVWWFVTLGGWAVSIVVILIVAL